MSRGNRGAKLLASDVDECKERIRLALGSEAAAKCKLEDGTVQFQLTLPSGSQVVVDIILLMPDQYPHSPALACCNDDEAVSGQLALVNESYETDAVLPQLLTDIFRALKAGQRETITARRCRATSGSSLYSWIQRPSCSLNGFQPALTPALPRTLRLRLAAVVQSPPQTLEMQKGKRKATRPWRPKLTPPAWILMVMRKAMRTTRASVMETTWQSGTTTRSQSFSGRCAAGASRFSWFKCCNELGFRSLEAGLAPALSLEGEAAESCLTAHPSARLLLLGGKAELFAACSCRDRPLQVARLRVTGWAWQVGAL